MVPSPPGDSSGDAAGNHYWINGGIGLGSAGGSAGVNVFYQTGMHVVSIRFVYNEEMRIMGPDPPESVRDLGALYGLILKKTQTDLASISAGVSFVGVILRGRYFYSSAEYEKLTYRTVGLALDGQFFWTPLPYFGLGVDIPANLNRDRSYVAMLFSLQCGVLR